MAKVQFNKLKCKCEDKVETIVFNDETIEVKQYLPIQEKLGLIGRVIMYAHEQDHNYANPVKAKSITSVEIIMSYTNISFTDKQKEDIAKLYDMIAGSGLLEAVIAAIPENELRAVYQGVDDTIESFYKYQNSILGLLDNITTNYDNLNFDLDDLTEKIKNKDNLMFISEILDKSN
jgi:hypothetical protein